MRVYAIGLFLFILQTFGAILLPYSSSMGWSTSIYIESPDSSSAQQVADTAKGIAPSESTGNIDPLSAALGWFYRGMTAAINKFFTATFPIIQYLAWLPFYLTAIGIPWEFSWGIFLVTLVVEAVGVIELWTGRDIER